MTLGKKITITVREKEKYLILFYCYRKISQFDNHKFLLVLWNKKLSRTEIFFDTAQRLAQNFKQTTYSNKPFKILNTDENCFIAVNEPKELIAIFDTKRAVVSF